MCVLDAIADDYENLEIISAHVTGLGTRCGLTVEPLDIERALTGLIEAGLAKAYVLLPTVKEVLGVPLFVPPADRRYELYF
jgi:hypothetical protein